MISRAALLDELVKIGAESEKALEKPKGAGHLLKTLLYTGAGTAAGYGLGELVARNHEFFKIPTQNRLETAKIILPILGGVAAMLAAGYRREMTKQHSKIRGYVGPEKRHQ